MYTVVLKAKEEKRILQGHPWVYANEVSRIEGKDVQGSIARVVAFDGAFVGYGYINHLSKIIVRMVTLSEETIDDAFWLARLSSAKQAKEALGYSDNYRVVFGESDGLPALIVDKYADYLSVQLLSMGMDVRRELFTRLLVQLFQPKGIYERSDAAVREKEGLQKRKGLLYGDVPPLVYIEENGLRIGVDIINGQKTGYFLDQKENRHAVMGYAKGADVLDCFSNVGGFALCAAKGGAASVTALDISGTAVDAIRTNAAENGFTCIEAVQCDVFEKLKEYKKTGRKFDLIIVDPPAFTKSKDTVKEAYRGYVSLNALALSVLKDGGCVFSCSCSQHLTLPLYLKMLQDSQYLAGVPLKLLEMRMQSRDHATLLSMDEALYLKVAVLKRV